MCYNFYYNKYKIIKKINDKMGKECRLFYDFLNVMLKNIDNLWIYLFSILNNKMN